MLHADDALVSNALTAWVDAIASPASSRAIMITGRHHTFVEDMTQLSRPRPAFPVASLLPSGGLSRAVLPLICPFMPFVLMRRDAYEGVGGLDSQFELTQDWRLSRSS